MKKEDNKNTAYLEALKKLRALVAAEYDAGGWLPPVREMCERFDVSDLTYRKASNCLVEDHTAKSYPRKGLYIIPKEQRLAKVGLVMSNGQESPFWVGADAVCDAIQEIISNGFFIHQINASPLPTLPQKALLHGINSLIWFSPRQEAYPIIEEIHQKKLVPQLVIPILSPTQETNYLENTANYITKDYQQMGKSRAQFLIGRGHKSVMYIGNYWFSEHSDFTATLKAANVNYGPEQCLNSTEEVEKQLLKKIEQYNITAIVSEGGDYQANLFDILSKMPEGKQPDLLIHNNFQLKFLHKKYPTVKIIGTDSNNKSLGTAAGKLLCDHLKNGTPLKATKVKTHYIEENIEEFLA